MSATSAASTLLADNGLLDAVGSVAGVAAFIALVAIPLYFIYGVFIMTPEERERGRRLRGEVGEGTTTAELDAVLAELEHNVTQVRGLRAQRHREEQQLMMGEQQLSETGHYH